MAGLPEGAELGETLVIRTGADVMEKPKEFDVWLPSWTVTLAEPAWAIKAAGTDALNCVVDTNVVDRTEPFQRMLAFWVKPDPFTVSTKVEPPRIAEDGERLVMVRPEALMAKPMEFDDWVPFCATTAAIPGWLIRLAAIGALNCVGDKNVVGSAEPFQRSFVLALKPAPDTVNENAAPPAVAFEGARVEMVNAGCVMVKGNGVGDVCPVKVTLTAAVPAFATRFAATSADN
jgi:hypothetical protein